MSTNVRPSSEANTAASGGLASGAERPAAANEALAQVLDRHTANGVLWKPEGERLRCVACGHRCLIPPGRRGICKVRFNAHGILRVPFGYVAGLQCDPVEKKPFFHVFPGSDALTFGMMGCDFHCAYCQNWVTSQALRDPASIAPIRPVTAEQLVAKAQQEGARILVSSYNEPLITTEWSVAVFQRARPLGLLCALVSNGNATPEVLDYLHPWIGAYKVDLKGFDERRYRSLGGTLDHVTETIRKVYARGWWLEVVTLLVPGFNDEESELRALTRFLASVSPDIPWHVTAFHQDYRLRESAPTIVSALIRAAEIGSESGLRFVYAGNMSGRVGAWENTRCPVCQETLIERNGFTIRSYRLTGGGQCPKCRNRIPGLWPAGGAAEVAVDGGGAGLLGRRPRLVR